MNCPQCGGDVWNNDRKNQQRVNEGKRPLPQFACKDKDGCGWIKWPPKNHGGGRGNGGGKGAPTPPRVTRPLGPLYYQAVKVAVATLKELVPNATPTDIVAAAATILIATRDGAPILAPKPAPPPPPASEADDEDYSDPENIPF